MQKYYHGLVLDWSSTELGSVGVGKYRIGWLQVLIGWFSDCADIRHRRGTTALGPCDLGLAADQVIIDPILGPTGQVCPSGVPQ